MKKPPAFAEGLCSRRWNPVDDLHDCVPAAEGFAPGPPLLEGRRADHGGNKTGRL